MLLKPPAGRGTDPGAPVGGWVWEPTGGLQLGIDTRGREKRGPIEQAPRLQPGQMAM